MDLNIEGVEHHDLVFKMLNNVDFEWRLEEVLSDHARQNRVSVLSELCLVEAQLNLIVFFPEAQALAKHLLQLVF